VSLEITGRAHKLPPGPALAAYRIVQESLTNVLRHARGARVAVRLRVDTTSVTIEVDDTPPRRRDPSPAAPRSESHGLIGLRERAEELGGWLTAGPCAEGGWRVRAWLPRRAAPVMRSGA
jgi:signal transduction histidine kinase